jgi:hypothetical protein
VPNPKSDAEEVCQFRNIFIAGKQVVGFGPEHKDRLSYGVLRQQLRAIGIDTKYVKDIQYCGQVIQLTVRATAAFAITNKLMKLAPAVLVKEDFNPATMSGLSKQISEDAASARFKSRCEYLATNARSVEIRRYYSLLLESFETTNTQQPESKNMDAVHAEHYSDHSPDTFHEAEPVVLPEVNTAKDTAPRVTPHVNQGASAADTVSICTFETAVLVKTNELKTPTTKAPSCTCLHATDVDMDASPCL